MTLWLTVLSAWAGPDGCEGLVWYADRDFDGFAARDAEPLWTGDSCRWHGVAGLSSDRIDCDDDAIGDILNNVGELCNGRDDDCDGLIDEPPQTDPRTWYPDRDRDGWGEGPATRGCPPGGSTWRGGDCDGDDPDRHPAAAERCDGIDNDCDGVIDPLCPAPARGCAHVPGLGVGWPLGLLLLRRRR